MKNRKKTIKTRKKVVSVAVKTILWSQIATHHTRTIVTRIAGRWVPKKKRFLRSCKMKIPFDLSTNSFLNFAFVMWIAFDYMLYLFFSNIPPNQGGKYSGFGYTMESNENNSMRPSQSFSLDNAVSSLTTVIIFYKCMVNILLKEIHYLFCDFITWKKSFLHPIDPFKMTDENLRSSFFEGTTSQAIHLLVLIVLENFCE